MKKLVFFPVLIASVVSCNLLGYADDSRPLTLTAFSAGYVLKNDCEFKRVYGHGMINIITADVCFYPWEHWGIGAKLSYWRAKGQTSFLKQSSLAQEVPLTVYLRGMKQFDCDVQLYASLGGGITWIKEKSYLGCITEHKGIGELEFGLNYPFWHCVNVTAAFRYLFPPQAQQCVKKDVGGCDFRAGIGFAF